VWCEGSVTVWCLPKGTAWGCDPLLAGPDFDRIGDEPDGQHRGRRTAKARRSDGRAKGWEEKYGPPLGRFQLGSK